MLLACLYFYVLRSQYLWFRAIMNSSQSGVFRTLRTRRVCISWTALCTGRIDGQGQCNRLRTYPRGPFSFSSKALWLTYSIFTAQGLECTWSFSERCDPQSAYSHKWNPLLTRATCPCMSVQHWKPTRNILVHKYRQRDQNSTQPARKVHLYL